MPSDWYLKIADKEVGPLTSHQLKAMAKKGQLAADDLVRQGTDGPWIPASRVRGLLVPSDAASSESTLTVLPTAQPLEEPPEESPTGTVVIAQKGKPAQGAKAGVPKKGVPLDGPRRAPPARGPVTAPPVAPGSTPATASSVAPGGPGAGTPMAAGMSGPPAPSGLGVVGVAPSGVRPNPRGAPGAAEAKKKKQARNTYVLVGLVLLLVVLFGAATLWMRPNKAPRGKTAARARTSAGPGTTEQAGAPVQLAGLEELEELKDSGSKPATKPPEPGAAAGGTPAAPPATAASPEEEAGWANAVTASVTKGNVRVKLNAVQKGPVRFTRSEEECLSIIVELHNTHDSKIRQYTSWTRTPGLSLTDNFENRYALKSVKLKTGSIYPGSSIEEMLVFQKPVPKATFLRLQLPAAAFDEDGVVRFQIPASMIEQVDAQAAEPQAKRPPRLPARRPAPEQEPSPQQPMSSDEPPPPEREEPTISRSIDELDKERAKPSDDAGGIPGVMPGGTQRPKAAPKPKPEDPDGDVSKINEDIEALGGGDKAERVADFESDPKRMAEFEQMRRQQRAEQDAQRKAGKRK